MTQAPSLSAIICTRNRASSLQRTLEAFRKLDIDGIPFELIVADSSTDRTPEVVESFKASAPFPVRRIFEPRSGLSYARNSGIHAATGSVILFTDDDCYPHPNWVRVVERLFADGIPKVVAGRIELFNKNHLNMCIQTSTKRDVLVSTANLIGFLQGSNFAFSRSILDRVGYFDVRLGAGARIPAAEDFDFAYRAMKAGVLVAYEPDLAVDHDHGRVTREEGQKLGYIYKMGLGGLAAKHLLKGKIDVARAMYWSVFGTIRAWRQGRCSFREVMYQVAMLDGALRFLFGASWRASV